MAATFTEKLEFPFLPDEAEHLIISLTERRSVLLIGRSGTGKTTIVVQRMWLKYRAAAEALSELSPRHMRPAAAAAAGGQAGEEGADMSAADSAPCVGMAVRQLFVTANPILRTSVEKSFRALQSGWREATVGAADGGGAVAALTGESVAALGEVGDSAWPLFLRAHHWLRLLDGTLPDGERFFTAEEREAATLPSAGFHAEVGGLEALPEFSMYDDEDGDDGADYGDDGGDDEEVGGGASAAGEAGGGEERRGGARVEMTFELFERVLWPLMVGKERAEAEPRPLAEMSSMAQARDLQEKVRRCAMKASVVFREIVSYIKGSSAALDAEGGRLSREEYCEQVGRKMAPQFEKVSAADGVSGTAADGGRGAVYDFFLKYEAWKAALRAYDVMDAAHHVYSALRRTGGYAGPTIDEVRAPLICREHQIARFVHALFASQIYVDEVQDFTQAELRLFLEVCADKNGLFFTGDTCQTIARGVGFRFEELTSLFHHLAERERRELEARGVRAAELPRELRVQVPEVNKLSVNYRTHNGILGAASEMVRLLLELFPHSVDALQKDVGHFDGPKPILLTDTSKDDLSILLCGSDPAHSQIEFGAHQAVLVRNQAAKRRLPTELERALVLTIFEAKGLEFDGSTAQHSIA